MSVTSISSAKHNALKDSVMTEIPSKIIPFVFIILAEVIFVRWVYPEIDIKDVIYSLIIIAFMILIFLKFLRKLL